MEQVLRFVDEYGMHEYEEIYKPIPNYDNYEVSNYGNVS